MIFLKSPGKEVRFRILYHLVVLLIESLYILPIAQIKILLWVCLQILDLANKDPHEARRKSTSRELSSWCWFKLLGLGTGQLGPNEVKCNLEKAFAGIRHSWMHKRILQNSSRYTSLLMNYMSYLKGLQGNMVWSQ